MARKSRQSVRNFTARQQDWRRWGASCNTWWSSSSAPQPARPTENDQARRCLLVGPTSYADRVPLNRITHVTAWADDIVRRMQALQSQARIEIVAIGVSTGGPQALTEVIPYLPANLAVPVIIVQHMPQTFTGALAASLNDKRVVTVVEGQNGQTLEAAMVYIARG